MSEERELLRQALGEVESSFDTHDALARTLDRIRRRRRRRKVVLASVTLLVFVGAGGGLLALTGTPGRDAPAGQPRPPAPSATPASPPSTAAPPKAAPFVPATRQRGGRAVLAVTFPDGSTAELTYPARLDLAGMGLQPDVTVLNRRDPAARSPLVFQHRRTPDPELLEGARPVGQLTTATGRPVEIWGSRPESRLAPEQAYWVRYVVGSWTVLAPAADLDAAEELARRLDGRPTGDGYVALDAGGPLALSREFGEGGGAQLAIGDRAPRPARVDAGGRFRLVLLSPMRRGCQQEGLSPAGDYASKCLAAPGSGGALLVSINGDRRFVQAVFDGLEAERVRLTP